MIVTQENETYYLQAMKVDFLTEDWEIEWYATALMQAAAWGTKIDKLNQEYFSSNHVVDKYNV